MAQRPTGDDPTLGATPQGDGLSTRVREGDSRPCVLLIGGGSLADATERALEAGGATVRRLHDPSDPEIRAALDERVYRVVVVSRFDHVSLLERPARG